MLNGFFTFVILIRPCRGYEFNRGRKKHNGRDFISIYLPHNRIQRYCNALSALQSAYIRILLHERSSRANYHSNDKTLSYVLRCIYMCTHMREFFFSFLDSPRVLNKSLTSRSSPFRSYIQNFLCLPRLSHNHNAREMKNTWGTCDWLELYLNDCSLVYISQHFIEQGYIFFSPKSF